MFALVLASIYFFSLMRFGLMAVVFIALIRRIVEAFPTTIDVSAWYSGYGFAVLGIYAVIVLYAFRTSFGGCPLLATSRLDE